jgi:uncharacterized damage-inducible protein DinB
VSTTTLLHSLFQFKAWSNAELYAQVATMDTEAQASARHAATRLLNHIYVVDRIFAAHLQGQPHAYTATNTAETPALNELAAAAATLDHWYIEHVATLGDAALSERIDFRFTDGDGGSMSREEMLAHIINHGGYHRGAVGRILVQQQVAPPRELYTRFLHEAQPQRRSVSPPA